MQPFIIFSLARTGSTTLLRLFNRRRGVRCLFEPFNHTNRDARLARCRDLLAQQGFQPTLQYIWSLGNGFKHVFRPDGWPYPENPNFNRQILLETGARIVLLHRRNALRRAISFQISEQMDLWTPNTAEEFRRIRAHHFRALDIPRLRTEIQTAQKALDEVRELLQNSQISWRQVAYEDFFDTNVPTETRLEAVQSLLEFIEVGRADMPELIAMRTYLNPAVTGFQNVDSYPKIPNIQEVERELGSAQNGFVFDVSTPPR